MASVVRRICDFCEGEEGVRWYTFDFASETGKYAEKFFIDICDECYNLHVSQAVIAITTAGRKDSDLRPKTAKGTKRVVCEYCDKQYSVKYISKHRAEAHKDELPTTFVCECKREFSSPQGLSMHKYRAHGEKVKA